MMISLNTSNTGKATLISGIFGVIGTIVLFAFFITESDTLGLAGDILFAINRLLFIPLILALAKIALDEHSVLSRVILVSGITGALILVVSGLLLIFQIMPYEQTVKGEAAGAGLFGIAIVIFAILNLNHPALNIIYKWFTVLVGFAVASNMLSLAFPDAANAVTEGTASFATVNPIILILMSIAGPLYLFGLPLWLLLTGRAFSKEKLAIPA